MKKSECKYCTCRHELVDMFSIGKNCYIRKDQLVIKLGDEEYSEPINYCPKCGSLLSAKPADTYQEIVEREG